MGVCDVSLFPLKIHAKCFQKTYKTMTLPILKITFMQHHLPYMSHVLGK